MGKHFFSGLKQTNKTARRRCSGLLYRGLASGSGPFVCSLCMFTLYLHGFSLGSPALSTVQKQWSANGCYRCVSITPSIAQNQNAKRKHRLTSQICIHMEVYCKSVKETLLSHLHLNGRWRTGWCDQFTINEKECYVWTKEEKNIIFTRNERNNGGNISWSQTTSKCRFIPRCISILLTVGSQGTHTILWELR